MEEILLAIGVFGFVTFSLVGANQLRSERARAHDRIIRALGKVDNGGDTLPPLRDRVVRPAMRNFTLKMLKFAPKGQRMGLNSRLNMAGLAGRWEATEWQGLQYSLSLFLGLSLYGLFTLLDASAFYRLEMGLLGLVIGYMLPNSWLKAQIKKRRREIEKTLPDVLDLLTVSVEAGLGFDAALMKVVEKQKGVLAEEFLKVLQEIRMGRPRREALRDLAKRNQVEDLSNVIASLVQADQLGIPIGGVLRNQAGQIRQKRRQRAEEKAQKAPVKMMIPLVFFVFPSVFIVILGPALIQILDIFMNQ